MYYKEKSNIIHVHFVGARSQTRGLNTMLLPQLLISAFSISYKVWEWGRSWSLPSPVLGHFFYDKKLEEINLRLEPCSLMHCLDHSFCCFGPEGRATLSENVVGPRDSFHSRWGADFFPILCSKNDSFPPTRHHLLNSFQLWTYLSIIDEETSYPITPKSPWADG